MFESDDFDQVLSQFELPEEPKENTNCEEVKAKASVDDCFIEPSVFKSDIRKENNKNLNSTSCIENSKCASPVSIKHTKRKLINSHFDHKNKRKFPGPAGLLSGSLEESKDNSECTIELLSQDIDYAQSHLQKHLFDSPLWSRLVEDLKVWKLQDVNSIKTIKQQALDGNLRKMKAQTVAAFVEMVDRSAIDPLITLRDNSGTIKCTLHRDAWSAFSQYIVAEYCAIVLWKPTVLTTGSIFKKHYLNITLSNIVAVYSSSIFEADEDIKAPDSYVMMQEQQFTVIKSDTPPRLDTKVNNHSTSNFEAIDDLDNLFSDEIF